MNIVFFVHAWAGTSNSGAEWTAHHYAKFLHDKGCNISVILPMGASIPMEDKFSFIAFYEQYSEDFHRNMMLSDIVITHLDCTGSAINWSRHYKKQLIFLSHNDNDYRVIRYKWQNIHVVYNNKANKKNINGGAYLNDSIICKPPIIAEDVMYNRKHGKYVTLINCNENKGGKILIELAKKLPKIKFLGVLGSYGDQIIDNSVKNIRYVEQTSSINLIYGKSNIILVPSDYESYGRVAIEAAINRLPVICTPTDGLVECLGNAGIYFERNEIDLMAEKIKQLMEDEILYDFHQNIMRNLATSVLNYQTQELDNFYNFIKNKSKILYNE